MCWTYGFKEAICITTRTMWNNLIFPILLLFFAQWKEIKYRPSSWFVLFKAVPFSFILSSTFQGLDIIYGCTNPSHPHTCMHYCFAAVLQRSFLSKRFHLKWKTSAPYGQANNLLFKLQLYCINGVPLVSLWAQCKPKELSKQQFWGERIVKGEKRILLVC